MKILSTQLPLRAGITQEQICATIIKWIKKSGPCQAVGEKFEQCGNKESVRITEGYCTIETLTCEMEDIRYFAFRLSHIFHEQTWDTEIIYEEGSTDKCITIHINCSGDTTAFDKVPKLRSEVVCAFISDELTESGLLPTQSKPIYVDFEQVDLLSDIFEGKRKLSLPLVYVSKIFDRFGYEVDIDELALRLAGMAYIVAENSSDVSYALKERSGKKLPFNGRTGIFYPNGKIDIIYSSDALWGGIDKKILNDVVKFVTAQTDAVAPTWGKLHTAKVKAENVLLEDYMDGYDTLEEKLIAAKEKISSLTEEVIALRNRNESLQAALAVSGVEESIITRSSLQEFFEGEQHDLLVTVLKEALMRHGNADTRQHELITDLLGNNDYIGNGREVEGVVKRVLSSGEAITKRDIQDLERVGFILVNESTHYKFVYRNNERYWFSVSKTPSDKRSGKNNASDIIKRLTVYQS